MKDFPLDKQMMLDVLNQDAKTIVFIEPYGSIHSLFKKAHDLEYNLIILTANEGLRKIDKVILNLANIVLIRDTADDDLIFQLVLKLSTWLSIDAIIPGFEYFVPIASRLATELHLPGIPYQVVNFSRDKFQMRRKLGLAGIRVPNYYYISRIEELKYLPDFVFPVVCKPVDAAGSVLVRKVMSPAELNEQAQQILLGEHVLWGHTLKQEMLVEEYINGKEYSVEGIVQNKQIYFYSITEKMLADQQAFIEIGHLVHAPLSSELKNKIYDYCSSVVSILGLDNTPFHAELRLARKNDPILMEIAARLAGDKIADLISLTLDTDYLAQVLAVYLGEPIECPEKQTAFAGIRFFYRPQLDKYSIVKKHYKEQTYGPFIQEEKYYYPSHHDIPAFPKALRRIGHVMMKGNDYAAIASMLNEVDNLTEFC